MTEGKIQNFLWKWYINASIVSRVLKWEALRQSIHCHTRFLHRSHCMNLRAACAEHIHALSCFQWWPIPLADWIGRHWKHEKAWMCSVLEGHRALSLHRLVAYARSVARSLRAFAASVTKSSPPAVLTLDAMLDLCCRCWKGLAWHPEFLATVIWVTRVMFHLRSLGQRSVSRYFSDPSSASESLQDFCRCVWF